MDESLIIAYSHTNNILIVNVIDMYKYHSGIYKKKQIKYRNKTISSLQTWYVYIYVFACRSRRMENYNQ
jgi:hypothetical protein